MYPTISFDDELIPPDVLKQRASRVAGGFAAMGIGEGDVVATVLRNEPAFLEAALAARQIGAYYCPVNWHFKGAETAHVLRDSGAKALVVHADLYDGIKDSVPQGVSVLVVRPRTLTAKVYRIESSASLSAGCLEDWDAWRDRQLPRAGEEARSRGMIPYTSGTTGQPKGVRRFPPRPEAAQQQTERVGQLNRAVLGLTSQARCLVSAPLYHSAPCLYAMAAAQCGAWLRLEPRFDPEDLLAAIGRHRISHLYLVPTMYARLLQLPDHVRCRYHLGSVRFVASTGSPRPPEVKREMIDWWGPIINECYASSETGYLTFISSGEALERPGSAGRPVGDAVIRIVGDDGNELPAGEIGTIYARQPAVPDFTYIGREEARRAIERDGLVTLGDVGYLDAQGYLYICDRSVDMVISGGVNIYPAEIEAVLGSMPGIGDCAVFGVPDKEFGESLVACVLPTPGACVDPESVRAWIRERLANFNVPRAVQLVAEMPREDTGKLFKRRLREAYLAAQPSSRDAEAPVRR